MFVEVNTSEVCEDPQFPDRETRYIFDHLKYALSRPSPFPLPAITVSLIDGRLVVTKGHKYLRIAQELGRPRIRAMISSDALPASEFIKQLPSGAVVVPRKELEREVMTPVLRDYHVYFFENPLDSESQEKFVRTFIGFFENLKTPFLKQSEKRVFSWSFPFDGYCAEFEANIPVGDKTWPPKYLKMSQDFSRNVARIVSFQGARFPG